MINDDNTPPSTNDDQTFDVIKEMFPKRKKLNTPLPEPDPYATGLSHIDAITIRKAIEGMQGAGGISQLDAKQLRRIVNTKCFTNEAKKITSTLAEICNNLSSLPANEESTKPLRAVRIVAIPKKAGGLRPIGVGEVLRRVITKVLAWKMKDDVKEATGSVHANGLQGACEAAIAAVQQEYEGGNTILVMDAEGAFTNLNRDTALLTAHRLTPNAYQTLLNFYDNTTTAYFNGKPISVEEGTIQGCSLSSHFYDIGVKLLSEEMKCNNVKQIWLCDDLTAIGDAKALKTWRAKIEKEGHKYGYMINPSKCYMITKDTEAKQVFSQEISDNKIKAQEGARYLEAPIGSKEFREEYAEEKLRQYNDKLTNLTRLAKTCPHSAYQLYQTHIKHQLTYMMRTSDVQKRIKETQNKLKELAEEVVGSKIDKQWKSEEIALPVKWGGLAINIADLAEEAQAHKRKSELFTEDLKNKLIMQDCSLPQKRNNNEINKEANVQTKEKASKLVEREKNKGEKTRMEENQL